MNISIIIITRNEEKRIAECLKSVCEQYTEDLFELLIVDGDSTDRTVDIVQEFQKEYRFISLIKCKQYGYSYQRNVGVLNAQGKYVVFLSGDTVVSKKLIYKYNKYLDSYDIIQGSVINVIDKVSFSKYIMEACNLIYHNYLYSMTETFSTVNVCVKRDLLLSRAFDEKINALEDKAWCLDFEGSVKYYRLKSGCVYHKIHDDFFQFGKKIYKEARIVGGIIGKARSRELKENVNFFEWYSYTKHFLAILIVAILVFILSVIQKKIWLSSLSFIVPVVYKILYMISICIKGKIRLSVYGFIFAYHYYDCVFRGVFRGLFF
ncbi:glycosyltransferase family 2 protein [Ruminococcus sp.]|uniref:glycosyltransferase family 2 protein n=1 Tax=Ruminococcus sp. TaxID=41978 RepID=UPI00388D1CEA